MHDTFHGRTNTDSARTSSSLAVNNDHHSTCVGEKLCYSMALLTFLLLNDGHNVLVHWHSHATLLMSSTATGAVFRFVLASTHYLRTLLNIYFVNVLTLISKIYTRKITLYSYYHSS